MPCRPYTILSISSSFLGCVMRGRRRVGHKRSLGNGWKKSSLMCQRLKHVNVAWTLSKRFNGVKFWRCIWLKFCRRNLGLFLPESNLMSERITKKDIDDFKVVMCPLIGTRIESLKLPVAALETIEPSQVGTIVGTLMDAMIPYLDIPGIGYKSMKGFLESGKATQITSILRVKDWS